MKKTKLLIIGSGPAGYAAGIYAGRAFLNPILVSGMEKGGQLTITTDVDNYPGFAETVQGPDLMTQMEKQAQRAGCKMLFDQISEINLKSQPFYAKGELGKEFEADSVIICTGAKAKWIDLPSIFKFLGYGISACATCDGNFYKNQIVGVIGGGNTAVEEALYLATICKEVILIHRRDSLRAEKILQERLFRAPNIKILWDHSLVEVLGKTSPKKVSGISLKNTKTGKPQNLSVNALFVAIGHQPATEIFQNQLDLDSEGYLMVEPGQTQTNIPGVFAAGDVCDKQYRQAITAAGMGCMAALDAEKFLNK